MIYQCDSDVVKDVGANAAIIYQNIKFWCEKNAANEHHFHEGLYWTYNSMEAFCKLFDCFTVSQIKTALNKLEENGFIKSGNFNKSGYDRTKWYADQGSLLHLPKIANGLDENRQPIPDSKPDIKKPSKKEAMFDLGEPTQKSVQDWFLEFWQVYPKKAGKPAALKAFQKAVTRTKPENIIQGAKNYAAWLSNAASGEFRPITKHPQGWLNDDRWADDDIQPQASEPNFWYGDKVYQ